MPSVSLHRTIQYGDAAALTAWAGAHAQRHLSEQRALSLQGVALAAPLVEGTPTGPWFGRHYQAHQGLARLSSPSTTTGIEPLATPWHDAATFDAWMRLHTQIHQRIDRMLGVTG